MKLFVYGRRKLVVSLFMGILLISCSEQKESKLKNTVNEMVIDSLSIEKIEKSAEIKDLNYQLDSLKRISDSLKAIAE